MYLAHYIEKAGTGTLDMIARCLEAGLPEPSFEQRGGQFVTTLWRDWLTEAILKKLVLNEHQNQAVAYVKKNGRISNKEYRELTGTGDRTALRDLADLLKKKVFQKVGTTGRGTYYVIRRKADKKPPNPP